MKPVLRWLARGAIPLLVVACAGEAGPEGPQGKQGPPGEPGTSGEAGTAGDSGSAASDSTDLAKRSLASLTLHVDANKGNDQNDGSSTGPLASLRRAVELAHATAQTVVMLKPGTYNGQIGDASAPGGNLLINRAAWLRFRATEPADVDKTVINAGFRIQKGSRVEFENIRFDQSPKTQIQFTVENAHLILDDCKAISLDGGHRFISGANANIWLRVLRDRHFVINYADPKDTGDEVIRVAYGSFLAFFGHNNGKQVYRTTVLNGPSTGVYVNSSKVYASGLHISGSGKASGLVLSRAANGKLTGGAAGAGLIFEKQSVGIAASAGSHLYIEGNGVVRENGWGLQASTGGSIRWSDISFSANTSGDTRKVLPATHVLEAF